MTTEREDQLRADLAEACRILAAEGHEHFDLGHASVRSAAVEGFWVKPAGLRLSEVSAGDLVLLDLEGRRLAGDSQLHSELPIHTEIYRRRSDVGAVIHTHPFNTAAFSASGATFEMVSQDSVLFVEGFGRFDSPQLIRSRELGMALAQTLAGGSVVVLRNHGLVVAAPSLEVAVVLAVSFERSLALQLAAARLAGVVAMSAAEASELARSLETSGPERMARLYRALRAAARQG
jgi:L-fuculose-phosphate aldolase